SAARLLASFVSHKGPFQSSVAIAPLNETVLGNLTHAKTRLKPGITRYEQDYRPPCCFRLTGHIGRAAEIKVFSNIGVKSVLEKLIPKFEKSSGHKLDVT
ncbi:MAG TPA: hypothetical protein VFJ59_13350, partial [Pseudolabrys sp.]|nr:hypothetical protein [Pseudolabrys sp.]